MTETVKRLRVSAASKAGAVSPAHAFAYDLICTLARRSQVISIYPHPCAVRVEYSPEGTGVSKRVTLDEIDLRVCRMTFRMVADEHGLRPGVIITNKSRRGALDDFDFAVDRMTWTSIFDLGALARRYVTADGVICRPKKEKQPPLAKKRR